MTIYGYKNKKKDEELPEFSYPAYEKSDAVKQAQAQLEQHMATQPSDYRSQYQEQMSSLLSQLQNRPNFQYDVNGDALYQQYKDRYIYNGQRAMEDTMGQAAALTGGYGSSYAQNVGQQAYNQYMMGLNDVIPELYQLALDKYDRETANLQNRYSMYANLDAQDYSRWQDQQSRWYNQLDRLTDNARYEAEQDLSRYAFGYNSAYDQYEKAVEAANEDPKLEPIIVDGENNNGSVSPGNIKTMQRLLGITEDGYWGSAAYEVAGGLTAEEAWEAYQQGKLQGKSKSGMSPTELTEFRNEQAKASEETNPPITPTRTARSDAFAANAQKNWPAEARAGNGYESFEEYLKTLIDYATYGPNKTLTEGEAAWLIKKHHLYEE